MVSAGADDDPRRSWCSPDDARDVDNTLERVSRLTVFDDTRRGDASVTKQSGHDFGFRGAVSTHSASGDE